MGFWSVYFAVLSAFLSMEGIGFFINQYVGRRKMKKFQEFEEQMKANGIDPATLLRGMSSPHDMHMPFPADPSAFSGGVTSSGENRVPVGQYL